MSAATAILRKDHKAWTSLNEGLRLVMVASAQLKNIAAKLPLTRAQEEAYARLDEVAIKADSAMKATTHLSLTSFTAEANWSAEAAAQECKTLHIDAQVIAKVREAQAVFSNAFADLPES